jgi:N-acetylneuraminate synthase
MVFICAEIGINHNGSLDIAKKLIDVAVDAGCDAVKFQKRSVEKVYAAEALNAPRDSPWGKTNRDQKLGLEFSLEQYGDIDNYCKSKNIDWYLSCWDVDSQIQMRKFNTKFNKVASAMLLHEKLLRTIAEEKKHTFVSTGMSTIDDITKAMNIFKEYDCPVELMHSHSAYPMSIEEANLKLIPALKEKFNCNVGYSGHEPSSYLVSVAATVLGATSIERHITLDRTMYGSDQAASVEPEGLKRMIRDIRAIEKILGDGTKRIWDSELPAMKKLREVFA